jgi:hypothetical protein
MIYFDSLESNCTVVHMYQLMTHFWNAIFGPHTLQMQAYGNPPQDILNEVMPGMPAMDSFNPAAGFGGAFGAPGFGAAGPAGMPPIPPELADMDPQKLQEACKMQ